MNLFGTPPTCFSSRTPLENTHTPASLLGLIVAPAYSLIIDSRVITRNMANRLEFSYSIQVIIHLLEAMSVPLVIVYRPQH